MLRIARARSFAVPLQHTGNQHAQQRQLSRESHQHQADEGRRGANPARAERVYEGLHVGQAVRTRVTVLHAALAVAAPLGSYVGREREAFGQGAVHVRRAAAGEGAGDGAEERCCGVQDEGRGDLRAARLEQRVRRGIGHGQGVVLLANKRFKRGLTSPRLSKKKETSAKSF